MKIITGSISLMLLLSACATTGGGQVGGGQISVGPGAKAVTATTNTKKPIEVLPVGTPLLDVIVPVFAPGLPEDPDDYEKQGIWPELRRAEANRFALNMKHALQNTSAFGGVRVAPDQTATGDLYVLGTIEQSNGEDVAMRLEVVDISGARWLAKSYKHRVKEAFHKDPRNKGKDPYQPIFAEAAADIAKLLRKKSKADLAQLRSITELRFAASFSENSFDEYLQNRNGIVRLTGLPDASDPMLARVRAIRVRDQLFIDRMQTHYETFSGQMDESYRVWQEQSIVESKAARKASKKAFGQAVLGGLITAAGIYALATGSGSGSPEGKAAGQAVGAIGTVAGIGLIAESFQTRKEAKFHRDSLSELGESLDIQLAPQVVQFEEKTVELTGNAAEQFGQWRNFLQQIYEQEATPETVL